MDVHSTSFKEYVRKRDDHIMVQKTKAAEQCVCPSKRLQYDRTKLLINMISSKKKYEYAHEIIL